MAHGGRGGTRRRGGRPPGRSRGLTSRGRERPCVGGARPGEVRADRRRAVAPTGPVRPDAHGIRPVLPRRADGEARPAVRIERTGEAVEVDPGAVDRPLVEGDAPANDLLPLLAAHGVRRQLGRRSPPARETQLRTTALSLPGLERPEGAVGRPLENALQGDANRPRPHGHVLPAHPSIHEDTTLRRDDGIAPRPFRAQPAHLGRSPGVHPEGRIAAAGKADRSLRHARRRKNRRRCPREDGDDLCPEVKPPVARCCPFFPDDGYRASRIRFRVKSREMPTAIRYGRGSLCGQAPTAKAARRTYRLGTAAAARTARESARSVN
jgi:hypothetical protein